MKYSMVAAAIIGSVVAAQHKAHAGFHMRRGAHAADDVCTVYTTVYETAPPVPAESVHVNTPPAVETSCTEEEKTMETAPPAPGTSMVGQPPAPSKPAQPEQPKDNHPEYPANTPSKPAGETPKETPATPEGGKPEYPATTPTVPEGGKGTPDAGKPEYPAGAPPASTYCTEEEETPKETPAVPEGHQPEHPATTPTVPEGGKETPDTGKPGYPANTPEGGKPDQPEGETPKETKPATPEGGKPEYPAGAPPASTSCTEEEGVPPQTPVVPEGGKGTPTPDAGKPEYPAGTPEGGKPEQPATTPEADKPEYPGATPEASTSCTDEEGVPPQTPVVPEGGKGTPTPEAGKPGYPANTPSQPEGETPKETKPATPEGGKPDYPANTPSKPAEETPKETKPATPEGGKPTGSYNEGDHIVTNGDKWAITYTPYANSGECKEKAEIQSDIKKISELGFTTIRSYSTDCGVFENVVPECEKYGLKVIYGIFLEGGGKDGKGPFSEYANNQLKDITEHAPKDSVAMVIVGNECIFNGNCKADELASYIDHVRDELHSCGFPTDTAVTTTEPVGTWEENGDALCSHIDVFACQVQPYFTQSVSAEDAGDFAAQQLEQAAKVCPEAASKGKYITEIGWPSAGQSNGKAHAGKEEQKTAMKKIMEKVGAESCLFSFQNDGWKDAGEYGVEQNFGCSDALN